VLVGYGSGGLAVIDPKRRSLVQVIPLPVHPEGFQIDGDRQRAYVNLPDAHAIAVVDTQNGRVVETWPAAHRANFPMALNAPEHVLAIVYRDPARLLLLDAATGETRQNVETCSDADDVFFDRNAALYVVCGAGIVQKLEYENGAYVVRTQIPTREGARTGLLVQDWGALIVGARASVSAPSALITIPVGK
jgi:DNA-binding beta-propeller fold protein YncE